MFVAVDSSPGARVGRSGKSGRGNLVHGTEARVCERETHGPQAGEVASIAPAPGKLGAYGFYFGAFLILQQ